MTKIILFFFIQTICMSAPTESLVDLNINSNLKSWEIVDDGVMGGKSAGKFELTPEGHGKFHGHVSLKNNGGFSSLHYNFAKTKVTAKTKVALRLKGDGKVYQFRVKHDRDNYYSYINSFSTNGEWQEIEIQLKDMYPSFRGRKLDLPNFEHDEITEITFLIGNKVKENFSLLIDKIELL